MIPTVSLERGSTDPARPPPPGQMLSCPQFVAACNASRPKGTKPLTLRTAARIVSRGDVERYRPGKRAWRIPVSEVSRFVREHEWQPDPLATD
jgi:hypothetical protein